MADNQQGRASSGDRARDQRLRVARLRDRAGRWSDDAVPGTRRAHRVNRSRSHRGSR
jgi:hypothetical protein